MLAICMIVAVVALSLLEVGCRSVHPKRHDEYTRPGLDPVLSDLCQEHSKSIPGMMKSHKIPGVSVALVDREGLFWGAGFGFTDYDGKIPVTRDTRFAVCSTSKAFTALAVMCAVRDGLVDLDVPITIYLPEFTINSRFEENPQEKITLRHLLYHTSGMTHEAPVGNSIQPSFKSLAEHANSISHTWLHFPVGASWKYSGAGYDLVSYILELQADQPFAYYLEEKVLRPLNMPNTTADKARIEADMTRAIGHSSRHFKRAALVSEVPYVGAGGVYTSANDLARFIQYFLNWGMLDGQRLIEEESITAMYTPSAYRNRGLGLEIYKGAVGHGGDGLGFSSRMIWSPELEIGGLILINTRDFSDYPNLHNDHWDWLVGVLRAIRDEELIQKKGDSPPRPARHDPRSLTLYPYPLPDPNTFTPYQDAWKKYVGKYWYVSTGGWERRNYSKLVMALGYNPEPIEVKEVDGYLCVEGEPVNEYRPGLFFTASGACLDFTGPTSTWGYHEIKKLKWVFP